MSFTYRTYRAVAIGAAIPAVFLGAMLLLLPGATAALGEWGFRLFILLGVVAIAGLIGWRATKP